MVAPQTGLTSCQIGNTGHPRTVRGIYLFHNILPVTYWLHIIDLLLLQTNTYSLYISPESLNSYANDNPNKSGELLKHCIDLSHDREYIPKSQWNATHLYLGATAGMRLVK